MNFREILEARRNPDLNKRRNGHTAALEFLQNTKNVNMYGVSMTDLPKLGINPGSRYNTPVGVYFYPASYYIKTKKNGYELPFKDEAKYIQILEISGNVLHIDDITEAEYSSYLDKIFENISTIAAIIGKSEKETTNRMANYILYAKDEANSTTPGGLLWYILYSLSSNVSRQKRVNAPPRSSVVWNKLLRTLGIDIIVDDGGGILHENEPYQGVALNPSAIKHAKMFINKVEMEDAEREKYAGAAAHNIRTYSIASFIDQLRTSSIKYNPKYSKLCLQISQNLFDFFNANQGSYTSLDRSDIDVIIQVAKQKDHETRFVIDYNYAKFPRLVRAVNESIEQWAYEKEDPTWVERPPTRQRAVYAVIVEKSLLLNMHTVYADIRKYPNDPKVQEMMTFLTDAFVKLEF